MAHVNTTGERRAKSAHPGRAPGPFQVRIEAGAPRPPSGRDFTRAQSARGVLQHSQGADGTTAEYYDNYDGEDGARGDGDGNDRRGLPVALTAGKRPCAP